MPAARGGCQPPRFEQGTRIPPTQEEWLAKDLTGAILEALALAWSTTTEAILNVSDPLYGKPPAKREVGTLRGQPLLTFARAIRRP